MAFFSPASYSAVKIVRPDEESPGASRKENTKQCRNILIHGHCKYQDKGCIYLHPPLQDSLPPAFVPAAARVKSPELSSSASTLSSSSLSTSGSVNINAPVFVPKGATPVISPATPFVVDPGVSSLPHAESQHSLQEFGEPSGYQDQFADPSAHDPLAEMQNLNMGMYAEQPYPDQIGDYVQGMYPAEYEQYDPMTAMPVEAFYPPQHAYVQQPLIHHLYTQPIPPPYSSYFVPEDFRQRLIRHSELSRTYNAAPGLPEELQGYHSLVPLESTGSERRKFGNWYSVVYRATNARDGGAHALRRVENFRLTSQAGFGPIERWMRVKHPGIVPIREAFTTHAFGDNSLVVSYKYYPEAKTLFDVHLKMGKTPVHPIPERLLWSYFMQMANAIKAVHDAGLAVRVIDATKVLVTDEHRVRISSCGIVDVITFSANSPPDANLFQYQQEDLVGLGRLMMALATLNLAAANNVGKSLDTMGKLYGNDIKNAVWWLVGNKSHPGTKTISHVFELIGGHRIAADLEESHLAIDKLESEFSSELENGRLVRLLCKFGFINERPEFARDPRWSETGDRYIIKLFRDYVFHQVDEAGNPVVDLTHVVTCLNKLDVGTEERLMLVSRDEQSCLVVSYKDVKTCIEAAFTELARGGR